MEYRQQKNPRPKNGKFHLLSIVIIFFLAALVTYINLGFNKDLIGDDAGVGYHFSATQLNLASNMWDSYIFPGRPNVAATVSFVHISSIHLLNKIGITPLVVDRLYYFLFFFVSGLGLYFLAFSVCKKLFDKNDVILWIASLSGAIFYILNNFTMILLSFPPTNYLFSYMFLPWLFLLYFKDFHLDDSLAKRIIFTLIFLMIIFGNPSNTISIIAFIVLYEIFFKKENKIIHRWKNFSLTVILILSLSVFIFLPTLGNSGNPYGQMLNNDASIIYNSANTSIDNLFRFLGHPSQETYIFNQFFQRNRSAVADYLILLLSFGFLLKKRIRGIEGFLFFSFLLFIFLAKSIHGPFSSINKWIYLNVPLFEMFRASYYKFIFFAVFSLSVLLSISLVTIKEKFVKFRLPTAVKVIIAIFPLLLIFLAASPFFSGNIVKNFHKTTIPPEYFEAREYFGSIDTDFSLLSLPQTADKMLNWGEGNYYASTDSPDPFLLGRPTWTSNWFLSKSPTDNDFAFYKNFLPKTNVKYIFLHKDISESYYFKVGIKGNPKGQTSFKLLDEQISQDSDFVLIWNNKYFKIYEIKPEKFGSHFEIPNKITVEDWQVEDLFGVGASQVWPKDTTIYLFEQNVGKEQLLGQIISGNSAVKSTFEYKKISPTKYRIRLQDVSEAFPLVFNESFQTGWKMYLNEIKGNDAKETGSAVSGIVENNNLKNGPIYETWLKKPTKSSNNQLVANTYANSWLVDPSIDCNSGGKCRKNPDGTYDMELVLEFWPQRLFYLGVGISATTLLICLGALLFSLVDRRLKNDNR